MFELDDSESFPNRELKVLRFWEKEKIFHQSLEATKGGPSFSFYDGPPFATGLPHYGHLLAGTIKDVVPRFWTMKGYHIPRRFGWDCHGLPIENEIEKAQGLSGAHAIEAFGIRHFNEECRQIVLRYTAEWESTVLRMGRWIDFKNSYHTMDKSFMESVWWVFGELYKKELVYEGFKVMPFSAKLGTPLSNFEANLNYRDVDDPSIVVSFPLKDDPEVSLIAWTTTPWTLPSNLALAVHPDLNYVKIRDKETGKMFILAQARVEMNFKEFDVLGTFKGSSLKGVQYLPAFTYFTGFEKDKTFRVVTDEFVTIEEGTGVVQLAPAFGEVDFFLCEKEGITAVCPVDQNGRFTTEVPDYQGMFVKDSDKAIISRLKKEKRLIHHGQIRHRYPFCWRSDTPLIYKAVKTWFVAVEKIKDPLLKANDKVHWVPGHVKDGRFGKWLENARDWAISRNRYWGTPIPLWRSSDGEIVVISSVKELEKLTGKEITDLHRHFIDDLTFNIRGKVFRRIPEVFDCWFESGSMPYAQNHFPFENEAATLNRFPADFIGEGLDQTRGWFYTLMVLAVALFDQPAFKNVIVNGIILAEDGTKMSKRLKNYPEPTAMIDQFGADAVRLYLLSSSAVIADDLKFSARGVELVLRQALIPLWNCYLFLATYASIYHFKPRENPKTPSAAIDKWIISRLHKLIEEVSDAMELYELQKAVHPLTQFVDELTDWYIRRSRSRFWADDDTPDRRQAFQTLYTVLHTVCRLTAPFIPFLSEAIFLRLRRSDEPISVHLCSFPKTGKAFRMPELESEMAITQQVTTLGHSLRKEHQLKVRQPLACAHVICPDKHELDRLKNQQALIASELNVKWVEFHTDETGFVKLKAKPNFRVLGKKIGHLMQAAQAEIGKLSLESLHHLLEGKSISITLQGEKITLSSEDISVEREVSPGVVAAVAGNLTLALNTDLSKELLMEGIARELVNVINKRRKECDFAVTDRINVKIKTSPEVHEAFETHRDYICHETVAMGFDFTSPPDQNNQQLDINGHPTVLSLHKVVHLNQ